MCHCGLNRLVASAVSDDLPAIQCVVIHEADPKIDKTINEVRQLPGNARLRSTVVVVAVPSGVDTPTSRVRNNGDDSEYEDFEAKIDGLGAELVSSCARPQQ